jgi:Ca-activated chloride channel family protein
MQRIIQVLRDVEKSQESQQRRGAMVVLVLFMLLILLVMTVFAVDVAYMQLIRTELRTSTDAAARAASEALARTQSPAIARQAAKDTAARNIVAGDPLQLADSDIVFGSASPNGNGLFQFNPGGVPTNSVRVFGRRTADSPSGSVQLFLGGILGQPIFEPQMRSSTTAIVRDIALVLDRSGSMRSQNKINDLKAAMSIFLDILDSTRSDERVSLTSYSTTGTKDQDMTSNLGLIRNAVNQMQAAGFTAIGQGMQIGSNSLEFDPQARPFSDKAIVLLTDGIENRGPFVNEVLPAVVNRGHVVYTITFGAGADQTLMRQVADATGGKHFHAPNGQALRDVFRDISSTLAVVMIE